MAAAEHEPAPARDPAAAGGAREGARDPAAAEGAGDDPWVLRVRRLFSGPCTFFRGVQSLDQLAAPTLPELAFIGRSNVGKSSLVNALTGRSTLARTSNTPGRTQQLNFFELSQEVILVDLPGYGFAKVSKDKVRDWTRLMKDYLRGRVPLARVHLLVDARHGLKEADRDMMRLLDEAAVAYQVILTKADKVPPPALAALVTATQAALRRHPAAFPEVLATSAASGHGIQTLRETIARFLDQRAGRD